MEKEAIMSLVDNNLTLINELGLPAVEIYMQMPFLIGLNIDKFSIEDEELRNIYYNLVYIHLEKTSQVFEANKHLWGKISKEEFFLNLVNKLANLARNGDEVVTNENFENYIKEQEQ